MHVCMLYIQKYFADPDAFVVTFMLCYIAMFTLEGGTSFSMAGSSRHVGHVAVNKNILKTVSLLSQQSVYFYIY